MISLGQLFFKDLGIDDGHKFDQNSKIWKARKQHRACRKGVHPRHDRPAWDLFSWEISGI
jgi:hypothetical protein